MRLRHKGINLILLCRVGFGQKEYKFCELIQRLIPSIHPCFGAIDEEGTMELYKILHWKLAYLHVYSQSQIGGNS